MNLTKHFCRTLAAGSALLFTSVSQANWTGGLEAGTQLGSGERPALRFYARNLGNPLSHYLYLDWSHESGGSSYRLGYNPTFAVSKSIYSFGKFSIEQDDPGEIERQIDATVGVGNHIFRSQNSRATVEAGIGGRQFRRPDEKSETDGFFFLGGLFTSKLIDLLRLDVSTEIRAGDSQTTIDSEVGISFRIGPNSAIKYAYRATRYDFDGTADTINDEDSFFTLTYGF